MVPPRIDEDTVSPPPDLTPLNDVRSFLRHVDDTLATVVIEMEIHARDVWMASLTTVGEHRRVKRLGRERAWLEGELVRRTPTVDSAEDPR